MKQRTLTGISLTVDAKSDKLLVMTYRRANTDWLASSTLGIGAHWTAQTAPRRGAACDFQNAVDRFRLQDFLGAVEESTADYVIFTATHALQMLPCPHPVVDSILPGRTAERDLLGEIGRGLAALGKRLIVYYNHSCNQGDDPPWEQAVGYHDRHKDRLVTNLRTIVSWLGERYGDLIQAWWFDSPYSLDPSGPYSSVTTDLQGFQFPWEDFTVAAATPGADTLLQDDGSATALNNSNWNWNDNYSAYNNDYYYAYGYANPKEATWTFQPNTDDIYDVYVSWSPNSSRQVID
ncbi:MAG: hypothetical protein R6V56_07570, partial [Lentisphaeria bacterium]